MLGQPHRRTTAADRVSLIDRPARWSWRRERIPVGRLATPGPQAADSGRTPSGSLPHQRRFGPHSLRHSFITAALDAACHSAMCKRQRRTPIPGRPCATTGHGSPSTATPPTSWPPSSRAQAAATPPTTGSGEGVPGFGPTLPNRNSARRESDEPLARPAEDPALCAAHLRGVPDGGRRLSEARPAVTRLLCRSRLGHRSPAG